MLKENILRLRNEGKSYNEIVSILGCSKATVSYHCSDSVKENFKKYRNINRKKVIVELKEAAGKKCIICGYNRCLSALHFHHINPSQKTENVSSINYNKGKYAAIEESKKCILICGNCHCELHEGLIKI